MEALGVIENSWNPEVFIGILEYMQKYWEHSESRDLERAFTYSGTQGYIGVHVEVLGSIGNTWNSDVFIVILGCMQKYGEHPESRNRERAFT